jgi:hypothetical protein
MTADQPPPTVTALVIPPADPPYTAAVQPSLAVLQELVGGPIEAVCRDGWHGYLHSEGKLLGLKPNQAATSLLFPAGGDVVAGVAVVLGDGPGGGEADVAADRVLPGPEAVQRVSLRSQGEVIAAVPALFGYPPAQSLVALAVEGAGW